MAIKNPQPNFNWRLDIATIENARVQLVTPPVVEHAVHKQGSQGVEADDKTPGKKMVGELVLEMLVPQDGGDGDIWDALKSAESLDRAIYAGDGYLYEVNPSNAPINTFRIVNGWISKIETSNYETLGDNSGDLKRTVTIQLKDYIRV